MDFEWVAIALGDVAWISLAFALGFVARSVQLPPLVGFLVAGFLLNAYGIGSGEMLQKLSDLGITLLLFTVGLKLNLRTLGRPQVWAVSGLHMSVVVVVIGFGIYELAQAGVPYVASLDLPRALLIAFALSFSSTVFVVKVLEAKGEIASLHGRIAIGILIMQDLAAVMFLAISSGQWPSPWALLIVLLFPLQPVLQQLLQRVGHGELMVLYGFLLALGGAEVFELVGLKGDLGAIVLGVLIASHPKAEEMAKTMLSFKDLFLLGFFLSIGMSGQLTIGALVAGALLTPLIFLKSALFFGLLTRFNLRARTSLLTSLNLTNYSEFGLIVAAIGVANGWISNDWLIVIAIALSFSFGAAAALNAIANKLYARYRTLWRRFQRPDRLPDDRQIDIDDATVVIIGMGGVGTGAYDKMRDRYGHAVAGVDIDPVTVRNQQSTGRRVLLGDPSDADFWDRVQAIHTVDLVMLALPKLATNLAVLEQLKAAAYTGRVAVTARFPDEVETLKKAGVSTVFNIYSEAGAGFAAHVLAESSA
ncbi:MAG: cation:proton antiporter [Gammaproteobacteria bacterium]|nr:cation:proton antiporter [Gammaproteobacteria bacterium]